MTPTARDVDLLTDATLRKLEAVMRPVVRDAVLLAMAPEPEPEPLSESERASLDKAAELLAPVFAEPKEDE
jgi:hypothetical protein